MVDVRVVVAGGKNTAYGQLIVAAQGPGQAQRPRQLIAQPQARPVIVGTDVPVDRDPMGMTPVVLPPCTASTETMTGSRGLVRSAGMAKMEPRTWLSR